MVTSTGKLNEISVIPRSENIVTSTCKTIYFMSIVCMHAPFAEGPVCS